MLYLFAGLCWPGGSLLSGLALQILVTFQLPGGLRTFLSPFSYKLNKHKTAPPFYLSLCVAFSQLLDSFFYVPSTCSISGLSIICLHQTFNQTNHPLCRETSHIFHLSLYFMDTNFTTCTCFQDSCLSMVIDCLPVLPHLHFRIC